MGLFKKNNKNKEEVTSSTNNVGVKFDSINKQKTSSQVAIPMTEDFGASEEFDPKKRTHFKPNEYKDVKQIADTFLQNKNIMVDLSNIPDIDKKRLMDFLLGVMYATNGSYKKIEKNLYYFWMNNGELF